MYLLYVDESGDCGLQNSPSRYFVLTGLVVHELRWHRYLGQIIGFRQRMKQSYGLKLREEIHAAHFITKPGDLVRIKRQDRLAILRHFADELATMTEISVINVVVDKSSKAVGYDVFEMAWKVLIQRFENTMANRNFPGPVNPDERGMLFPDNTDNKKLTKILRKLRHYNPVPNQIDAGYRNLSVKNIIEDPNFRSSDDSYFVQASDLCAFLLYQHIAPNLYMRQKSGQNYFKRLEPILCKVASSKNQYGIVYL
jgi:Protein of unknown function (DUF3800)